MFINILSSVFVGYIKIKAWIFRQHDLVRIIPLFNHTTTPFFSEKASQLPPHER